MSEPNGLTENPHPCANCGSTLQGKYCCQCGQKAHVHRSLSAIGHDLAHGVLHIDGKIWNTLPLLLLKPGELTRRYIAGERAKFLSPMGLYLFSIFVLFAVMAFAPSSETADVQVKPSVEQGAAKPAEKKSAYGDYFTEEHAASISAAEKKAGIQPNWLDMKARKAFADRDMLAYKMKSNGYKLAWLLIPFSLPFMWLVMVGRRGFYLYDHAVFVTYSISFIGLLVSVAAVVGIVSWLGWLEMAMLFLIPPLHLYKHLKGSYALGRKEALARMVLLLFSIMLVIFSYIALLLFMGIL